MNVEILEIEFDLGCNNGKALKDFSESSARKVWWKCSVNPLHKWEARIFSRRKQGAGCPYCKGKKVLPEDSLAIQYPELIQEWNYEKNEINPSETHCRSGKKVWWTCLNQHHYESSITHRTSGGRNGKGTGCPYCSNQKTCEDNSILITHPQLIKEWDFTKNTISPTELVAGSHEIVWWKCPVADDHEWQASLYNRTRYKTGCPCCEKGRSKKVVKSNCLETTHPKIAKEWHPTKNIFTPRDVSYASNKKAWFICKDDNSHEWKCRIAPRCTSGHGCPFCASSKGEKAIKEWLDENKIKYKQEYKIEKCINKRQLPFDFAIFNNNKLIGLIEYQGRQHYEPIDYFGGLKSLLLMQANDRIKFAYCKDNNIPLLVIPYMEHDLIENKLKLFLN